MNIKIVICFIIICFLPVASASTADVRAAKQSGFIKSSQSLSFENYFITSEVLDNTRAAVTVHKNNALVETREFNVNEFKKYDNIMITLLGIYGDYSWISISKPETKDVFRPLSRTLLKWGDTYTIEDYSLHIDTFGSDSVNLVISNKSAQQTGVFSSGDSNDYGTLRITMRDINKTGFIDLELFTSKAPEIKALVLTDKDEYFPDEPILVTINTSSDFAQNIMGVIIETNPPVKIQQNSFSATGITGTHSFQSQMTGQAANSTVTINAKIESRDYNNNAYIQTVSKDIFITPDVSLIKSAPADTDDENVTVQLFVYNSGLDNKSIHVSDNIPEELTAKKLDWDIQLGSKKSTTLVYSITPQKPGLYILPAAAAQWNGKTSMSRRVKMTMHMPAISMTKTAAGNKSQTDVKLVISNNGDRPAQVKVSDKIPEGYSIVQGDTVWSGKLESGESATIMYSLQGIVNVLPAASGTYRDMRGVTRQVQSNVVEPKTKSINANTEKKEGVPTPTLKTEPYGVISFMILSFIAIGGIIAGLTLVAYLFAKVKRKK